MQKKQKRKIAQVIESTATVSSGTQTSPQSENEIFKNAIDLYVKKDYLQSARLLRGLILTQPEKSLYWFNFANCFYMLKHYDRAEFYFNKVIMLNTKFVEISRIYKAKSLTAMGREDEGRQILTSLLTQDISPSFKKLAQVELDQLDITADTEAEALKKYTDGQFAEAEKVLLDSGDAENLPVAAKILLGLIYYKQYKKSESLKIFSDLSRYRFLTAEEKSIVSEFYNRAKQKDQSTKPYWLTFDLSYGQNDNIYLDGASIEPITSGVMRAGFSAGYHFFKNEELSYKLNFGINEELPQNAAELKIQNQSLTANVLYEKETLLINWSPFFQHQIWNGQKALQKNGFTSTFSEQLTTNEYGLSVDVIDKQALSTEFSYLKGTDFSIKPFYGYWSDSKYTQFQLIVGFDPTADIFYSDGSRLPLNQIYNGFGFKTMWQINNKNVFNADGVYVQRNYKNTALPSGIMRIDQELGLSLKYSYYFLPQTSIYGTIDYTNNKSTLGAFEVRDKNYSTTVMSIGLVWEVFD